MRRATLGALCFWRAPSTACAARCPRRPRRPRNRHRQATPHDSPTPQRVFEFPPHFEGSRSTCSPIGLIDHVARWRVRTSRTHPEAPKLSAIHPPPLWTSNPDGGFAFEALLSAVRLWVLPLGFLALFLGGRESARRRAPRLHGRRAHRRASPNRKPESKARIASPNRKPEI